MFCSRIENSGNPWIWDLRWPISTSVGFPDRDRKFLPSENIFYQIFFTLPKIHKNTRENNCARAVASALTLRGTRAKGVRNSKFPNPSQMGLSGAQIQGYRRDLMEILSNRVIYQVPGSRKPWKCFLATNNWLGNHLRPPRRPHTTHRLPEAKVATK